MRNYPSEQEAKELICAIGKKMYDHQFVSANDGNITIRVGENEIIATPTGVSKGGFTAGYVIKNRFEWKYFRRNMETNI